MPHPTVLPASSVLSGITDLPHLGVLRAQGADAAHFLHAQLTQDILQLPADQARLAGFCSAKGRLLASFIALKPAADTVLLVCSRDVLAATLKRLSMFVLRAQVRLSDASAEFALSGLVGQAATQAAASFAIKSVADGAINTWPVAEMNGSFAVLLSPAAGHARLLCCTPVAAPQLPFADAAPLALADWQWLAVQSGIAMVSAPLVGTLVPQMLNYESVGGVNFQKGCYPGQEVVARSQFRGTLKRRAYLLHSDAEPTVGQAIFHSSDTEQPCGIVAAAAPCPTLLYPSHLKPPAWERADGRPAALKSLAGGAAPASFCALQSIPADAPPNSVSPSGRGIGPGFDLIASLQTAAASDAQNGQLRLGSPDGPALMLRPLPYVLREDI